MSDYHFYILEPGVRDSQFGINAFGNFSTTIKYLKYEYYSTVCGFLFQNWSQLNTIECPNLTSVDPTNLQAGEIFFTGTMPGLTSVNLSALKIVAGFCALINCTSLSSLDFPELTDVGEDFAIGGATVITSITAPKLRQTGSRFVTSQAALECSSNPKIKFFALPALTSITVNGQLSIDNASTSLTALSCPSLVIAGDILISAPSLSTVDFSSLLPTNGKTYSFFGANSLTTGTKNAFLSRCVANPAFVSGNVVLPGQPLSGQGLTDRATLTARGVTVTA